MSNTTLSMPDDQPPGRKPPNNDELGLLATTFVAVCRMAQVPGNLLNAVAQLARKNRAAQLATEHTDALATLAVARQRFRAADQTLKQSRLHLRSLPRTIPTGKRKKIGLLAVCLIALTSLALFGILFAENGAAGQILVDIGAFGITSLGEGRMIMVTPIAVGIALVFGIRLLPQRVSRVVMPLAVFALVIVFAAWCVGFAVETQRFQQAASQTFSLSQDWDAQATNPEEVENGWGSMVMFGSLVLLMPLTTFLGHYGLESLVHRYEEHVPNPECDRISQDIVVLESITEGAKKEVATAEARLAVFEAMIDREESGATAMYLTLRNRLAAILMIVTLTAAGCAPVKESATVPGSDWFEQSMEQSKAVQPAIRVMAISPFLKVNDVQHAQRLIEQELEFIANDAPVGSMSLLLNAYDCTPIAQLRAKKGVKRIRMKDLAKSLPSIRSFLHSPKKSKRERDGRVHLPRLAETVRQMRLPLDSHVVVFGSPLFLDSGSDSYFSMVDGRVPTDGCLFEPPELNMYSVLGRERALNGQYWHLGWSDNEVFQDDSHRQATLRFWTLYFQHQSATLVTAQASFSAAMDAARERLDEPLMNVEADLDSEPAMQRRIRVETERVVVPEQPKQQSKSSGLEPKQLPTKSSKPDSEQKSEGQNSDRKVKATEIPRQTPVDDFGNVVGSRHDLLRDGEATGKKLLLLTCVDHEQVDASRVDAALRKKGFDVTNLTYPLPSVNNFGNLLDDCQQVWVLSGTDKAKLQLPYAAEIANRFTRGNLSVCLLADNTPFTAEAEKILKLLVPDARISGEYVGQQYLMPRTGKVGFDSKHPLYFNIRKLYEGSTVSAISGTGLRPICYATDGQTLVASLERNNNRLVVMGGFTSLMPAYWDDAGISRFAVNCAGWLSGKN